MNVAQLRAMSHAAAAADTPFQGQEVKVDVAHKDDRSIFIVHTTPFEADRMRLILGAKYNRNEDRWVMPATRTQAAALSGVFEGRLDSTQAAKDHVAELFAKPPPSRYPLADHLFDFQRTGVHFLRSAGSALLGDAMGVGKTIQAIEWIRLCNETDTDRHIVICPNSMKFKWGTEIEKWWPGANAVVVDGSAGARRKQIAQGLELETPVIFVINYESLRTHTSLAPYGGKARTAAQKEAKELNSLRFRCVVVDEAHKIKDPKALQTLATKQMGLQADYRLAMTGTPLLNNPDDIWSIMHFVAPEEWGSKRQFQNRYCRMTNAWHRGMENLGLKTETREELDAFFLPRFLRRTKAEVLPDLPEKMPIDYRVLPLTSKQKTIYNALVKDMMAEVDEELLLSTNPLSLLTRLRQVACGVPIVNEAGEVTGLDTPSNKLNAIEDILEEAPGDPLVIYAESRKFIEMLAASLQSKHRIGMVTGAQTAAERERAVKHFQEGKTDIILGTLGAGAEGLTLTRANRIVLAQQSASHGTNAQAIDRVHRIGQTRGVQPIVLLSQNTVDEGFAFLDVTKEGRLQELVRDPAFFSKLMTGDIDEASNPAP